MPDGDDLSREILDQLYDGVYYVDPSRTIRYWNRAAEALTGFSADEVVGRRCMDGVLDHVDEHGTSLCKGMCPLAKTMADGRLREVQIYAHHKDGHRKPVVVRTAPIRDPRGGIVGAVEIFSDAGEAVATRQRLEELQRMALFDSLTEIGNRRYLEMNLHSKLQELERYDWPFGVLFVDVDRFKRVNDTFGHDAGDETLRMVAKTLAFSSRSADAVGRWGGEEFLVVVANADREALATTAERLRALVAQSTLDHGEWQIQVTISLGGTLARKGDTPDALMARADRRLYHSKRSGRDRATLRQV